MSFISIRKKLSVLTVSFIMMTLVITLALSALFILITARSLVAQGHTNIRDALVNKGQILLFNSQLSLKRMVEENAFADLEQDVRGTVQSDDDIIYGTYVDTAGRIWCSHFQNESYRDSLFPYIGNSIDTITVPSLDSIHVNGEDLIEFSAPIYLGDEKAGVVRYGFSMGKMNQQLKSFEERMYLLLFSSFLTLLLFLAPLVYVELKAARRQAREITEPLAELAEAAKEIRDGDFSRPITVVSNDEVGSLAQDMDLMRTTLEQYHTALQKRVDETKIRLNSSLKEQLFQANKLVTLGTLVAGTAHEINNPNNAILLAGQTLERYCNDLLPILDHYADICGDFKVGATTYEEERDKLVSSIEQIGRNSRRISNIVRQLKNYGRKDTVTHYVEVDLNCVVRDSIEILSREITRSTNDFTISLDTSMPKILGNTQQLEQVVVNLMQNACQAVVSADGTVHVRTEHDTEEDTVNILVSDTGVGMDEETLTHMFDSFFTRKSDKGGSGLGLYVSQRIIKEHSGEIRIESTPGKGTVATVVLPIEPKGGTNELLFTTAD